MTRPDVLIAATHLRWVVDDLEVGVAGRWPVKWVRHPETIPAVDDLAATAWWMPTGQAAYLTAAGLDLQLACVDPGWMGRLPRRWTGRTITTATLAWAASHTQLLPAAGFVKPSLAKLDQLPAGWRDDLPGAVVAAAGRLPAGTMVEWSPTRLDLAVEWRTFVLYGVPCRPSPYLVGGQPWEPEFDARADVDTDGAWRFARQVARWADAAGQAPAGWVLDVACTVDGRWLVVEANAPWSSGTYGCALDRVVDTVVAASMPPVDRRWRWRPDPAEVATAAGRL